MVQIATPTKEQIAKDPRAFSLYCQALHGNSGFNAEVNQRFVFGVYLRRHPASRL
jgi:hypothetical protein